MRYSLLNIAKSLSVGGKKGSFCVCDSVAMKYQLFVWFHIFFAEKSCFCNSIPQFFVLVPLYVNYSV